MSFNSKSNYIKDAELFKMSNSILFDLGAWIFFISILKRAQDLQVAGEGCNLKSSKARSASQKTTYFCLSFVTKDSFQKLKTNQ